MNSFVLVGVISFCASFCASELIDRFVKSSPWAQDLDARMNRAVRKLGIRIGFPS